MGFIRPVCQEVMLFPGSIYLWLIFFFFYPPGSIGLGFVSLVCGLGDFVITVLETRSQNVCLVS